MAWRYEFYFLVLKAIFYSLSALIRKMLFLRLKVKFISSRRRVILWSLSTRVFETRTATGIGHFSSKDSGVSQIFIRIVSNGEKILGNVNVVVWRQVKRENSSLLVAVRVSKTRVLKLPIFYYYNENCPNTPVPRGCLASPPQPWANGWEYGDIITKISRIDRFPKKSYRFCSAGAVCAPEPRYYLQCTD